MSNKDKTDNDLNNTKELSVTSKLLIQSYRNNYKNINPEILLSLSALKQIVSQPKQNNPDSAADKIENVLGDAEAGETLRQERWHAGLYCPCCNSQNVKRLALDKQETPNNYKYLCLACNTTFNDDSETKIEQGFPPVNSWMFCWYLLGCTNSIQYIANKLRLSVTTVEIMIRHMQELFNTSEPLKHFLSFDEWILENKEHKLAVKEYIEKKQELYTGMNVAQPKDTAEVRKQRNRSKPNPRK